MCECLCDYIHMYTYISIYVCVCVYLELITYMRWPERAMTRNTHAQTLTHIPPPCTQNTNYIINTYRYVCMCSCKFATGCSSGGPRQPTHNRIKSLILVCLLVCLHVCTYMYLSLSAALCFWLCLCHALYFCGCCCCGFSVYMAWEIWFVLWLLHQQPEATRHAGALWWLRSWWLWWKGQQSFCANKIKCVHMLNYSFAHIQAVVCLLLACLACGKWATNV